MQQFQHPQMALSQLHLGSGSRGCSSSVTAVLVQVHTPQQAQKVLALLPSLLWFCLRPRFLLHLCMQTGIHVGAACHKRPSPTATTGISGGLLHSICSGLCLRQRYLHVFCSLRFQVSARTVSDTSVRSNRPGEGSGAQTMLPSSAPAAHSQHLGFLT